MDDSRVRHRQGQVTLANGVPLPDPRTTLSLLPNSLTGAWLAGHVDVLAGRLLDLGAANQPFRPWYEPHVDSVIAIDVTPAPGLDVLGLAAPLPFADRSFDTVLCTFVLEHVDNAEAAVAEMYRVLRPGGNLLIAAPFLYPTHEAPWDFWRVTHWGLRSVLARNGFDVVDVGAQGGPVVLVLHYLFGGLGQVIAKTGERMGKLGVLVDNPVVRWVISAPQRIIRPLLTARLTGPAKAASLGYLALAHRPD